MFIRKTNIREASEARVRGFLKGTSSGTIPGTDGTNFRLVQGVAFICDNLPYLGGPTDLGKLQRELFRPVAILAQAFFMPPSLLLGRCLRW